MTIVFTGLCLVAMLHILEAAPPLPYVVLALLAMVGLLSSQLFLVSKRARGLSLRTLALISLVQFSVGFLPFLAFGQSWVGMPGFVAGGALLLLRPPYSIAAFCAAVIGTGAIQAALAPSVLIVTYTTVSTVLTGLIIYGLSRMALLVEEVHETRAEMARLAVFKERLRFARDLHDLLGYSLSAITLKSELTRRLVSRHPERALTELDEILDISRQALTDVRSLASGYRDMSFDDEARSARSVLAAADITVTMNQQHPPLPVEVSTVLATVLREGVTNLLRHSKAERCEITVATTAGCVRLSIANDGVLDEEIPPSEHGGSGILNLTARAADAGGTLTARHGEDGWFRLNVELPLQGGSGDGDAATASRRHALSG